MRLKFMRCSFEYPQDHSFWPPLPTSISQFIFDDLRTTMADRCMELITSYKQISSGQVVITYCPLYADNNSIPYTSVELPKTIIFHSTK